MTVDVNDITIPMCLHVEFEGKETVHNCRQTNRILDTDVNGDTAEISEIRLRVILRYAHVFNEYVDHLATQVITEAPVLKHLCDDDAGDDDASLNISQE